ncbi:hypothetical protein [Bradyrhizobium japonicum]
MNAIQMVAGQSAIAEVICENHEDVLIKRPDGRFIGRQTLRQSRESQS